MKSQPRGFTLLEVLVALSLLGLLMVLIASALIASNHTQELGERYSNRLNEVRSAQDFLRSAAQQAYPMVFLRDAQNLAEVFDGEAQQMRFVARCRRACPVACNCTRSPWWTTATVQRTCKWRSSSSTPRGCMPGATRRSCCPTWTAGS